MATDLNLDEPASKQQHETRSRESGRDQGIAILSEHNQEPGAAIDDPIATTTDLDRFRQELSRANRALTVLSEINFVLSHASDESGLIESVCKVFTGTCGYALAWIGIARNDPDKSVEVLTAQGRAVGYSKALQLSWGITADEQDPAGAAIRTGQLLITYDNNPAMQNGMTHEASSKYGLHSMCAIPMHMDDGTSWVLALYADCPDVFTPQETGFLAQLATDLIFGISVIHEREKRRKAEDALEAKSVALSFTNDEQLATNEELTNANDEAMALNDELDATLFSLGESQAELRAAKEYAERLIETACVIVVGLDRDGRVNLVNRSATQLLGYGKHELLGHDWFEIVIPPGQRAQLRALYHDMRDGKAILPPQVTNAVQTKSGDLRSIEWHNDVLEREGKFAGCLAIGVDITESLLAAQALSASEIRYRRLFESAKDGILILDANTGIVVDVNPYLSELLGLSFDQVLGKKVWELGFLKDVAASRENFIELQKHEYIRYEDLPLETADGKRIDAEFVSNVYQVNGDLVIQCNIRNITARKRAENELQALHLVLESRVAERTAELAQANAALQYETVKRMHAEEMQLIAVLEERTRIAREIHDTLAQGFAGIIIQLEAAEDVMLVDPRVAHTHVIKARQLARDSLTDARRSMWALRPQMLEKGDLVYAISSVVDAMAKESSIHMEFTYTGQRTKLPKDMEDDLLRICQEALMNAGKHSRAQNIDVTLELSTDYVELSINDDGQGFDSSSTPFLRGLGLRIMKERAAQMNGTINIVSEPGHGAVVQVRVPYSASGHGG